MRRFGFGGSMICSAKSVNFCMSAAGSSASLPTRPGKATLKLLKLTFSSNADTAVPGGLERSPRQCIAPLPFMPRRVCVVIGPFIGWKSFTRPEPLIGVSWTTLK